MFCQLSRIVAWLAMAFGSIKVAMGFWMTTLEPVARDEALKRYTTETTTGSVIDDGLWYISLALLLGTIAEIGLAMRRR